MEGRCRKAKEGRGGGRKDGSLRGELRGGGGREDVRSISAYGEDMRNAGRQKMNSLVTLWTLDSRNPIQGPSLYPQPPEKGDDLKQTRGRGPNEIRSRRSDARDEVQIPGGC